MRKLSERNRGRFRPLGGEGLGPSGECECPKCGYTKPHETGRPCFFKRCPECGTRLRRK